jgi:hypothetical protein
MPAIYREPLYPLKVLPLAVLRPCTTSESATPPSSLIQAHAPNHNPLTTSELTSRSKSLHGSEGDVYVFMLYSGTSTQTHFLGRIAPPF